MPVRPARRTARRVALVVATVLAVAALALFEPWKLVVDRTVAEPVPVSAPGAAAGPARPPEVLARGRFVPHEHATTGSVQVLRLADGSRVLRLEGLDTSDGPSLRVWLTDAPVIEGFDGWFVFDDGAWVDLGALRGNVGDSNYAVPADVDLDRLTSVSIWCERFAVSFGAAALERD